MADNWLDQYPTASPLDEALAHEGVDGDVADIARSIYQQESSSGKNTRTSNAGAVGGMQIVPATFDRVADKGWDIKDPVQNARAGVRYIKALYDRAEGDPHLTAVGYYGGEGAQDKARQGVAVSDPRNPKAPNTLQYAQAVVDRMPKKDVAAPAPASSDDWLKQFPLATDADVKAATAPAKGAAASAAPKRTTLQELGRQLGLTARAAAQGIVSLPAVASDAVTGVINKGLDAVEGEGNGFRFQRAQAALDNVMNRAGVPQPENATERVVQDVGSAMTGAGTAAKAGQVLAKAASPVAAAVGDKLAEGAGMQIGSAAAGAGASGITREEGGGTGAQIAAGLAGSLAPGFAAPAAKEATRRILRGGEAGRQQTADNIARFEAAGTTPTLGQATEGRVARATESLLAKTPGGAGVIAKKAQQQVDDLAQSVQAISDQLAPGASAANAGEAIARGVKAFKDGFKGVQKELYRNLDEHIPDDTRIGVDQTRAALADLNEDIAGAPALSKWFKNAKIAGLEGGLKSDTGGIDAVLTRPGMKEQVAQLRASLEDQAKQVTAANAERRMLGMRNLEPVMTPEQIEERVQGFLEQQVDNKLPYESVKKLRTLVGNEIADGSLVADVPRSKWTKLYAALSEDLGQAAQAAGPKAEEAWRWANTFTKQQLERLDQLSGIVSKDSPEKIFSAAISGTAEGDTIVKRVMNALPKQERREVAAAVLQRLGRASAGQQNAMGDAFSAETFLTNLSKLSPAARKTIFGRTDVEGIQEKVADLAKVAESRREGGKVFANPSGTASAGAQQALSIGGTLGALGGVATGNFLPLAGALAVPAAANAAARFVTNPSFVREIAKPTTLAPGARAAAVEAAGRSGNAQPKAPDDWLKQYPQTDAAPQPQMPAGQAPAPGGALPLTPGAPVADPARAKARIQALRDAGEDTIADALEQRQKNAEALQAADQELSAFAQSPHPLFHMSEFADGYRALRAEGKAPGEAAGRTAVSVAYSTIGKQAGLTDKMLQAGISAAEKKPAAEIPAFLEKYVTALASKGAVPPEASAAVAEAMHGAWNDAVDHTVAHLYPDQQEPASDVAAADGAGAPPPDQVAAAGAAAAPDARAEGHGAPVHAVAGADGQRGADAVHAGAEPAPDVAGDLHFASEQRPDGTLLLKGDAQAIHDTLTAAGIPADSMRAGRDGVLVGRTQAGKVQQAIDRIQAAADLDAQAHQAATSPHNDKPEPTEQQAKAGNYEKGHVRLHGLDISIENPKGSTRRGIAPDGTAWESQLASHYGYVKGSRGADGDHVDVFIGPDPHSEKVFVVDQLNEDGSFDEHKAMLGFHTAQEAEQGYLANYDEGWDGMGAITELPMAAFKSWVHDGVKKKPLGDISQVAEARAEAQRQQVQAQAEREQQEERAATVARLHARRDAVASAREQAAGEVA